MRIFTLLAALLLGAWTLPAQAQARYIQCEDCVPMQMRNTAAARGHAGGSFYVFSLKKKVMLRYWVEYDHRDSMRWIATPIEPEDAALDMFAHMLNAYELKSNVFIGQQVYRGRIDDIGGGPHDPVGITLRPRSDDGYVRFINHMTSCLGSATCTRRISPALAELNLGQKKALSLNISLFKLGSFDFSWEDAPPQPTVYLCNENQDCAVLEYENDRWVYVESRAEGGNGKVYPRLPEPEMYRFGNSGEAGIINRGLRGGGASIIGSWSPTKRLACTSVGDNYRCEYHYVP